MKPICATCGVFFRVIRNGEYFEEGMPGPHGAKRKDKPLPEGWHCGICGPYAEGPCPGHPMFDRLAGTGRDAPLKEPGPLDGWQPYKLWRGDLWRCPCCGTLLISGVAAEPIAEHYEADYQELKTRFNITRRIDDC